MSTYWVDTSKEQDAALEWRAAQLAITPQAVITQMVQVPLREVERAHLVMDVARVQDAYRKADQAAREAAKTGLGVKDVLEKGPVIDARL